MMWWRAAPFTLGGSGRAHLRVRGLSAGYGGFLVLRDLQLEALPGLTVILGPNGAGKSTLLKALAGLIPRRGVVMLDGEHLPDKAHEIVGAGIALVAEGRQLFPQMSELEVLELLLAGHKNRAVAAELGISPRTVEVHRARMMRRLGVKNFTELIRLAVEVGVTRGKRRK